MSEIDNIRRSMGIVGQALEEAAVPYVVVGSVAGLSHGYGRATIDVDVLAEMDVSAVENFVKLVEDVRDAAGAERYFVDAEMIRSAIRQRGSFNLFDFETGLKIDIFVSRRRAFDEEVMARREMETMSDDAPAFYVQTAEDLILSKIQWFELGNRVSDRQWNDIQAVIKVNQFTLDFDYLEHWAAQLKITDLVNQALKEAGLKENI